MDADEYQSLLNDFFRDQDQQKKILDILTQMSESDLLNFLGLNLIVFSKFQDEAMCNITITMIYIHVKKGTIFTSSETATTFWTNFVQVIPESFRSKVLSDNLKYRVSQIISYFAIHFYRLHQNTQIQEYLLTLYEENPDFESFVFSSIDEIVICSNGFGGFPFEALLKIITMNPLQYDSSVVPRLKLFYSIVLHVFKSDEESSEFEEIKPELINLFPQLFEATPESLFDKVISTTEIFAETYSEFFQPHLSAFIPVLCKFAKDSSCPFRNNAIFCIESIAKGSINMCSSYESYYIPVISTLISIMSEITEDSPIEEDLNDTNSFTIAHGTIRFFLQNCQNKAIYTYLFNFFKETVTEIVGSEVDESTFVYEKVPWQVMYSFIYAFSYRNATLVFTPLKSNEGEDEEEEENENEMFDSPEKAQQAYNEYYELLISLLPFLTNSDTVIHLKKAIYNMISSFSENLYTLYANTSDSNLVSILISNIFEESNIDLQKSGAAALSDYIENGKYLLTEEDYVNVFMYTAENLSKIPPHLIIYFIHLLKSFVNNIVMRFQPDILSTFVHILTELYECNQQSSNDDLLDIQVYIFISILNRLSLIDKELNEIKKMPEMPEKIMSMLKDSIDVLDQGKYKDDEIELKKSIIICIRLFDQDSIPLIEQFNLLERSLEGSSKSINIDKFFQFDVVEEDMATLVKVDSSDEEANKGAKFYISSNELEEVESSLDMLTTIIHIIKLKSIKSLEDIVQICQKWITNDYHVESLKLKSWLLLNELIIDFIETPEFQVPLSCFTEDFINCLGVGSINYNLQILNLMSDFIQLQYIEKSSMPLILEKVDKYTDFIIFQIAKYNAELISYNLISKVVINESNMPVQISRYRLILESGSLFFKRSFKKYTDETLLFFNKGYLEKIHSYMGKIESLEFAAEVDTYFVCTIKDVEVAKQLISWLFGVFLKCMNQISVTVSTCLATLYMNIDLPIDFISSLIPAYHFFFSKDLTSLTNYSDCAVGTLSVLITKYCNQMNECQPLSDFKMEDDYDLVCENLCDNAIYVFVKALPIWDINQYNNYALNLIISLMQQQNKFIMEPYDFARIWYNLICRIDDEVFMSNEIRMKLIILVREINSNPQLREIVTNNLTKELKEIWAQISEEQ